jgi:hypothetical protein
MVIRSTVKPHEKSPEESSEDRQQPNGNGQVLVQAQPAPVQGQQILQPNAMNEIPSPRDETSDLHACDIDITDVTSDQDLPPTEGGVE